MTSVLDVPVRVDRRGEHIYFFDGAVCVDVQSGTPAQRKAVLDLLAHAQELARFELADTAGHRGDRNEPCACRRCQVLREAGLVSDSGGKVSGCAELCDFEPCRKAGRCEG